MLVPFLFTSFALLSNVPASGPASPPQGLLYSVKDEGGGQVAEEDIRKMLEGRAETVSDPQLKSPFYFDVSNADVTAISKRMDLIDESNKRVQRKLGKGKTEETLLIGLRYFCKLLFSPLGQLGGHGFSRVGQEGFWLYKVYPGTPLAKAGMQPWDRITKVNGILLDRLPIDETLDDGPIVVIGEQLDLAEARGGSIRFDFEREGRMLSVEIPVAIRGGFADPASCAAKKERMLKLCLEHLKKTQLPDGRWQCGRANGSNFTTYLALLALLASGDKEYKPLVEKAMRLIYTLDTPHRTWDEGIRGIVLAEYFWATGDTECYRELQEHCDRMASYVNPCGGAGHSYLKGTYGGVNFGPPAGLVFLAVNLGRKLDVALIEKQLQLQRENYLADPDACSANYSGFLCGDTKNPRMGEGGFRSAVAGLALKQLPEGQKLYSQILDNFNRHHRQVTHIHACPSLGMIFGSLMLASGDGKGFQDHFRYRHWWLTVARMPDDSIAYVYPKKARMAIPGGGGWNGDSILGFPTVSAIQTAILLSATQPRLLVTGKGRAGWYSGCAPEQVMQVASDYQKRRVADLLAQAETRIVADPWQAYQSLALLRDCYHDGKYVDHAKVGRLIARIEAAAGPLVRKNVMEAESLYYFTWLSQNRPPAMKHYAPIFLQLYPESSKASEVRKMISDTGN
ncbi:MAG: hypothetical protein RL095_1706 [Verrucomicrobiota bacterium]|jgi:hypothetical protein